METTINTQEEVLSKKPGPAVKKRVLVFIPQFPTISETFIEREISKLVEKNTFNYSILSLKRGRGILSANLKDKVMYGKLNFFNVIPSIFYFLFMLIVHPKKLSKAFELTNDKGLNLVKRAYLLFRSVGYYTRVFSKYKPDFIYVHFLSEPSTIVMITAAVMDLPFGISGHAKDIFVTGQLLVQKVKRAEFITLCNKKAYDHLVKLGGEDNRKIHLNYHGADFDRLINMSQEDPLEKPGKPVILYTGRFVEKKGNTYLIQAAKLLKEHAIPFVVYIVGGGPIYKDLLKQIADLGLTDDVKVIGGEKGTPFNEIIRYYNIADIFAYPAIETAEGDADGIATVLIEAAIFKLPIDATTAGSTQDLVVDHETGLIVPQKSVYELVEALEKLLVDKDLHIKLAENAYSKAAAMFNIDSNIVAIEELICG
jgi:glycosyltransferase involved in cell wall biosynthesis